MLEITNLSKQYKNNTEFSIRDVNIKVEGGEIFGFLGPNGAGKSTTIKCVTGILPYSEGSIKVCGYDLQENAIKAKMEIGYVPDNHILYETLTAREYVKFISDIYKVGLNDRKVRSEKLLEIFDLTNDYDKQISTYSHGMKQKICVIGALVHNPKLWILDEPMTGLDPKSSHTLKTLMKEHCSEGNSVFFSSHMLEVVEKVCDRIAIINKGVLLEVGSLEDIKSNHNSSLEDFFLSVTSSGEGNFSEHVAFTEEK